MDIAYMDHLIHPGMRFDPDKFCWIPMAVALSFPETTVVTRLVKKETTQPPP